LFIGGHYISRAYKRSRQAKGLIGRFTSPAPRRGRHAELALESAAEGCFGFVTAALGHAGDGVSVAE
jgi:hypothetical protein